MNAFGSFVPRLSFLSEKAVGHGDSWKLAMPVSRNKRIFSQQTPRDADLFGFGMKVVLASSGAALSLQVIPQLRPSLIWEDENLFHCQR